MSTAIGTLEKIAVDAENAAKPKAKLGVNHPFLLMGEHAHGDTFTSQRLPFEDAMSRFADIAIYMSERGGQVELIRAEPGKKIAVISRYNSAQ